MRKEKERWWQEALTRLALPHVDKALHALGGGFNAWWIDERWWVELLINLEVGFLREVAQKKTWAFWKFSGHTWGELLAWPAGAALYQLLL